MQTAPALALGGASSYKRGTTLGTPPLPLRRLLEPQNLILGRPLDGLGHPGTAWTTKISSWDVLGCLWGGLWTSWGGLGTSWGASGVGLGRPALARPGASLGRPWETLPKKVPKKIKQMLPKPHICDNGLQLLGGRFIPKPLRSRPWGGASSYKGGTTLGIPPFPNDVPWTPKISSWDVLGRLWGCLGRPWATLVRPGAPLGRPWDALGHLWGGLGTPWGTSGVALGRPGAPLGWPWDGLGHLWGGLGRPCQKRYSKRAKKTLPKLRTCDNGP